MRPIVLGVLLAAVAVAAPAPPPIRIDVTALDATGLPVPGLLPQDFRVTLNGRAQTVRAATYLETTPLAPGPIGRVVVSNTGPRPVPRVVVLAVDDLSFPAGAGQRLLSAAGRFAAALPAGTFVGLTTTSGRVIVNPTADSGAATAALMKVQGQYRDPRTSSVANAASISLV